MKECRARSRRTGHDGPARAHRGRPRIGRVAGPAARRRPAARRGASRVNWERVGRIALTLVLAAVLYSYLNPAIDFVKTYTATTAAKAQFHEALKENKRLHWQVQHSDDPVVLDEKARGQGLVGAGTPRSSSAASPDSPRRRWRPVVSAGSYILSAAALVALVASLGFSAVRLRARLIPAWNGAPARLVEAILGIALLIWLAELLGTFSLLYAWTLIASSLLLAGALAWRSDPRPLPICRGWRGEGGRGRLRPQRPPPPPTGPAGRSSPVPAVGSS